MTVVIVIAAVAGTVWLHENEELVRRIAQSPFALPALFVVSVVSKVIKNILFAYGGSLGIDWLSRLFG